tara:strand:- start:31486 stop:31773 length:288 start_codon:yes stop_codon:yes gene_type:complete
MKLDYKNLNEVLTSPRMSEFDIQEEGVPQIIGVFKEGGVNHAEPIDISLEDTDEVAVERYKKMLVSYNSRRLLKQKKRTFVRVYRVFHVIKVVKV